MAMTNIELIEVLKKLPPTDTVVAHDLKDDLTWDVETVVHILKSEDGCRNDLVLLGFKKDE